MSALKPVKVGVLGLGTVGCGTANILLRNADEIARRAGRGIEITIASMRDTNKQRACNTSSIILTQDSNKVVTDPGIEIVLELIGGTDEARELVLKAIDNGKHVVTANKALIALHGNEVFPTCARKRCNRCV